MLFAGVVSFLQSETGLRTMQAVMGLLALITMFTAWTWLRLQPQSYFFHLLIFNFLLLLYTYFISLPQEAILPYLAYLRFAPYTQIAWHLSVLLWLVAAPFGYGGVQQEASILQLIRRQKSPIWALAALVVLLSAAVLADVRGAWLSFARHDFYLWAIGMAVLGIVAIIAAARRFPRARNERITYLIATGLFIGASYLNIFVSTHMSALVAIGASLALLFLILLYHRRFVALEAELRQGLFAENQRLREENAVHAHILEHTREGVLLLDREENIEFANAAFGRLTGLDETQLQRRRLRDVVSKNFYELIAPALKSARRGEGGEVEIVLHRSGRDIALHLRALARHDTLNKFAGYHLGFFEITEHLSRWRALQEKLQKKEARLNLLQASLEHIEDAVIITGAGGNILYANAAFQNLTGHQRAQILDQPLVNYVPETEGRVASGAAGMRQTCSILRADGTTFPADFSLSRQKAGDEAPEYFIWTFRDAEPRKQDQATIGALQATLKQKDAEAALRERDFELLLQATKTGFMLVRPDGACRYLNAAAKEMIGLEADELSLQKLPAFLRNLLQMTVNYGEKIHTEITEFTDTLRRVDRSERYLRWRVQPVGPASDSRFAGLLVELVDLTQQQALSQRCRELDERLAAAVQQQATDLHAHMARVSALLAFSEKVQTGMARQEMLQNLLQTAQALGWPHLAILGKNSGGMRFELLRAQGLQPQAAATLKTLPAAEVERYFQKRFALGAGYFLPAGQSKQKTKGRILLADGLFPARGDWAAGSLLLLPLKWEEQTIGLMLCGPPEDGTLPQEQELAALESLARFTAAALHREREAANQAAAREQHTLLKKLDRLVHYEKSAELELQKLITQAAALLQAGFCVIYHGPLLLVAAARFRAGKVSAVRISPKEAATLEAELATRLPEQGAAICPDAGALENLSRLLQLRGKDARSCIVSAMHSRGEMRGVIACVPQNAGHATPETAAFIAELAESLGLVLENRMLFNQVEAKAQELEQANALISEFLANVSHELRTPLHAILSYAELLQQRPEAPRQERLRFLNTIQTSGDKLLRLINDLLDLSKIEAGKIEPLPEDFDPRELLREVEAEVAPLCREKDIALRLQIDDSLPPRVRTDRQMLARVMLNLARNAQKFTDVGEVEIAGRMLGDGVLQLQVRDTGIGIAKSQQKAIFEPFRQLDRKTSRRFEGTGLGLAISKRLVDLLGGHLAVQSKLGEGSTFLVEVPVEQVAAAPAKKPAPRRKKAKKSQKRSMQVLLVDDDESTREAMKFFLENAGYHVEFASDGPTAVTQAQHLRPDVILLDIMMPGMDGYEVARILKSQKQLRQIPVIALTARAMSDDRQRARAAGFDDFLTKPFRMEEFFDKLAAHTGAVVKAEGKG